MRDTDSKEAAPSGMDLTQLERTLQASIKLMKRGRREMERMRRKPNRQDHAGQGQGAS
jgi:hypothetical protein